MNKILVSLFVIASIFFISGCSGKRDNSGEKQRDIIEINEIVFLTQVNDIYRNAGDFLGKTIKLEGIFQKEIRRDQEFNLVIRRSPGGCCGDDGMVGFEVRWADSKSAFPASGVWVEATGLFKEGIRGGSRFYFLDLVTLKELDKRGTEFVTR